MYRLYGGLQTLTLLDLSYTERDIIESINDLIFSIENPRFIIIKNVNGEDIPYKFIYSLDDYLEYVADYVKRNPKVNLNKKRVLKNDNDNKMV